MNHATRSRAYDRVALLEEAKLPLPELIEAAARLLDGALPRDSVCWHAMDPATLIETSYAVENMPPPDARVAEFAYQAGDYNGFSELIRGPRHSAVLSEATGGDLNRSRRYRELLSPNGVRGELRVTLVADGSCWGCVSFFREAPHDFTADERDFMHGMSAVLGRAFRRSGIHARPTAPGAELWPGVLVLGNDREIVSVTPPAVDWLQEFGYYGAPGRDPLPFEVVSLVERVRATAGDATARVLGASGRWIQLHASPAGSGQEVAVVLQAAPSVSIEPLISAAYGLTTRERELIELVLQGCGTREIAERLFVSPHTVQSHLKSIFGKVGVRSRRELVGRVFAP
ncbi:helix-turn-helix transcriptional regulator [Kribbella ginsengisoli]|uniref:LuxR C-terminal-related transcriptional regulator n=1 Tax=Kribbella ginsengisoli TaxID=363865 RepID=A0ABP6WG93_9ACTN